MAAIFGNVYLPQLPDNPSAQDYADAINFISERMGDMGHFYSPEETETQHAVLSDLRHQYDMASGGTGFFQQPVVPNGFTQEHQSGFMGYTGNAANTSGYVTSPPIPGSWPIFPGDSNAASQQQTLTPTFSSPTEASQPSNSGKRGSAYDYEMPNSKRASAEASPAVTPAATSASGYRNTKNVFHDSLHVHGAQDAGRLGVNASLPQSALSPRQGPPRAPQPWASFQQSTPAPGFHFSTNAPTQAFNNLPTQPAQYWSSAMTQYGAPAHPAPAPTNVKNEPSIHAPRPMRTWDVVDLTNDSDDTDDEIVTAPPVRAPAYVTPSNPDPFAELNNAFRPTMNNASAAFNQDVMAPEQLAEFLITSNSRGLPMNGAGLLPYHQRTVPMIPDNRPDWVRGYAPEDSEDDHILDNYQAASPEAISNLLENIKPDDETPRELREPTPTQMSCELMEHQRLGLKWLKEKEQGSNRGGILADDMGLGKTIQALALILARPSEDPAKKTTLIVAPVALMRQWQKEFERHVKPRHKLKTYVYHGNGLRADHTMLRQYDVVFTTYGTLSSERKRKENRSEALKAAKEQEDPTYRRSARDKLALLGKECSWYRVVLDEAQNIKNRNTQTSKAAAELTRISKHRLVMSGTPMMNSIDELFPLLRFLGIAPYQDWPKFSIEIARLVKDRDERTRQRGMQRVQALLKGIMLRRTKDTVIDGQPICTIPPKHVRTQDVRFSEEEQELYSAIQTKSQLQFNKYLKKGTVVNNYANILVMLLRLRQACCHPHLIKDLAVQVSTEGLPEAELRRRAETLSEDVIARLKETEAFECPVCFDGTPNPTVFLPCGHTTCGECFQKLVDPAKAIQDGNEGNTNARCPHCRGPLSADNITDYAHFCKVHYPEKLDEIPGIVAADEEEEEEQDDDSEEEDDDNDDEHKGCKRSKDGYALDNFVVDDDKVDGDYTPEPDNAAGESSGEPKQAKKRNKGKGKGPAKPQKTLAQLKKESLRNAAAKKKYLRRLRKLWISSAKIDKTLELLEEIQQKDPTEKILIFSQFTSLLDLLEIPLMDKKLQYRRYDGSMKATDREDAVSDFMDDEDTKIMLISLKAGNAGLNLTRASQVLILDPFWNPFVEEQAVDRAHRMRQTREVHVHRVLVPNTVEDRICELQDMKRDLITQALDERAGKNVSRLGVRELMYLFGVGARPDH